MTTSDITTDSRSGELPEALRADIEQILDDAGIDIDRSLVRAILETGIELGRENTTRLDLKITSAALREMRSAFLTFAPFRDTPKVTIFGSARTRPDSPLYRAAHDSAAAL